MDGSYSYLPLREQSVVLRRQITATALRVFAGWGYREIEVPLIDDFDSLKQGLCPGQVEQSLRFLDRSGNVKILRYDSTPAIAKALSFSIGEARSPHRVCYSNEVVRIEKGLTKSQLESHQIGIELIGVAGIAAEVELVCICIEVLRQLGLSHFKLNLADHALIARVLGLTGAPARVRNDVLLAIRARDAFSARTTLSKLGVREKFIDVVEAFCSIEGGLEPLDIIEFHLGDDPEVLRYINRMRELIRILEALQLSPYVHLDLGSLRKPQYYDGISFNIVTEGVGRSIGGGGRYDRLLAAFGKSSPAAGFAVSADRLCEIVYPQVSLNSPYDTISETIVVSEANLVSGFQQALDQRRLQKNTRVVVSKLLDSSTYSND